MMDPRLRNGLVLTVAVILAFLVGFGWQWSRAESLQDELETTTRDLTFQRLQSTLAAAALDAREGTFETARQHASEFYSGLQQSMDQAPPEAAPALQEILASRDAMITALSRSSPEASAQLHRLVLRWRVAFDEPVGPPAGGPGPAGYPADTQPGAVTGDTMGAGAVPPPATGGSEPQRP